MIDVAGLREHVGRTAAEYAEEPTAAYRVRLRDVLVHGWRALQSLLAAEARYGCKAVVDMIDGEPVLILQGRGRVYYR